jgi:uncharacterized membrane protein YeaQ/YmgE (transglycosylase-associated protein family)
MLHCNRITLRRTDKGLTTAIVPFGPRLAGNQRRARVFLRGHECIVRAVGRRIMVQSLIAWLIVGAIAGWLAGLIVKGFGFGLIGNIVVGIVGAVIAGWLLPQLGIGLGVGMVAAIINAVIGAVVLLVIIGLIRRAS